MRTIKSKSLAALAALTLGVAVAGASFPASANNTNVYNPLAPNAESNSATFLGGVTEANAVGSADAWTPIAPVGSYQPNCHLQDNYKKPFCD